MKKITIDPITRLEGHGKIEIFLDDKGNVKNAYLQIPELRGFEVFSLGRAAEEMPRITPKICGVCPTAHHMASTKALDDLYKIEPTETARKIREIIYCAFMVEDHALHFYFLGSPDFIVGPGAPAGSRNILGVIEKVGLETGKRVIEMRKRLRSIITFFGGRVIHPVCGLPGGVSKGLDENERKNIEGIARDAIDFAKFSLDAFRNIVLKNEEYVKLITGDIYRHRTYYMGLVDKNNKVNFYDGKIRVVNPDGREFAKFDVKDFGDHIAEHKEEWSYVKFPYLKKIGWKGFTDGEKSGVYRVAPLARLNASDGMATEYADKEHDAMFKTLGGKPSHHTLAFHWARLVEMLYAAERLLELSSDKSITSKDLRNLPERKPEEGIGVVEAPRGTLIHHYRTDERGVLNYVNLLVATYGNAAAISMSITKAAENLIKKGQVSDEILNKVEMAFRAYDPCMACATHSLPGQMPLTLNIYDHERHLIKKLSR